MKKNPGKQRQKLVTKQALVWGRVLERTLATQFGDEWSRPTTFPEVVGRGWRYTTNEYFTSHRQALKCLQISLHFQFQ